MAVVRWKAKVKAARRADGIGSGEETANDVVVLGPTLVMVFGFSVQTATFFDPHQRFRTDPPCVM